MNRHRISIVLLLAAVLALVAAGCSTLPPPSPVSEPVTVDQPAPGAVLRALAIDRATEDRILALNPERITESDVRTILAKGPTPRVIGVHGGIYPVYLMMESFAQFLISMGYPDERLRDIGDGSVSRIPYES